MRHHLVRTAALFVALVAAVALTACSSSSTGEDAAAADPTTTTAAEATTTTTVDPDGDLEAFCAGFTELAAGRDPDDPSALDLGDGSPEDVAAAYAAQRATVEEIAAAAPAEMADNAETYAEVIVVRAEAAAATGATSLAEMDPATREDFIEAHAGQQAEINELLDYGRQTCGGF